jgi:HEAT repeat protein
MRRLRTLALVSLVALAACQTTTQKAGVEGNKKNEIVAAEIDRRIDELRYLHGSDLLQSMTRLVAIGDPARESIRAGAKSDDWLTRASLAWVMGATSDRRYIDDLRGMLADQVSGVRYEAAAALVTLGDSSGFAVLVAGLSDADIRARYKCFESLKRATGQDFGYRHDAAPETRRVAVTRWADWLEGLRANAL